MLGAGFVGRILALMCSFGSLLGGSWVVGAQVG